MSPSNTVPGIASTSLPTSTPASWQNRKEAVPSQGALTWSAEGVSDPTSRYYSRKAHIPSPSSGITIGRGYDLKQHSESEILRDFTAAGLTKEQAALFASARSLSGLAAHTFIETSGLPEISAEEEEALFQISWASALKDVQRISALPLVVQAYGAIDWSTISPAIRDLLVDLRYRGDYTPQTRALVQSAAAKNDLQSLSEVLSNRQLWLQVPRDRFERRSQVAAAASESQPSGM
jgi:hypothetical protein